MKRTCISILINKKIITCQTQISQKIASLIWPLLLLTLDLTDKWFYKLIKDGEFPKPIKLGRCSRWTESEVKSWLKQRMEKSRGN